MALTGEWTPEKWDYWLEQARQAKWLTADELAMASRALMMGQIEGDCQLHMPTQNNQTNLSFDNFAKKYAHLMPNARLQGWQLWHDDIYENQTPVERTKQRHEVVRQMIEHDLLNSPVLTQLHQMGYTPEVAIGKVDILL